MIILKGPFSGFEIESGWAWKSCVDNTHFSAAGEIFQS